MDWTAIITTVLSGITIGGVVEIFANIRFRKERAREKQAEAKQKEAEAKVSDIESQKAEIDLAVHFKDEMLAMMEQLSAKQDTGNGNQERMLQELATLKVEVGNVVAYLDGPYNDWLTNQSKKSKKKGETTCAE